MWCLLQHETTTLNARVPLARQRLLSDLVPLPTISRGRTRSLQQGAPHDRLLFAHIFFELSRWGSLAAVNGDAVEIRLLGALQVVRAGEFVPVRGKRRVALLAALAASPGFTASRDRLIDAVWGEALPRDPAHALESLVSQLRVGLGAIGDARPLIELVNDRYVFDATMISTDEARFRDAIDEGRAAVEAGDAVGALASFTTALGQWRGRPLEGLDLGFAFEGHVVELEGLHDVAVVGRLQASLDLGQHEKIIGELRGLAAADPIRERWWAMLMIALYRSSRQTEALRVYDEARKQLISVGSEPGRQLKELEGWVLAQDRSLDAPAQRAVDEVPRETEVAAVGVSYRLLGDVGLSVDGESRPLRGRRQREVLAFLLLETETETPWERIAHELWGEAQPKTAANSVERFIAEIRGCLGPYAERLGRGSAGYRLEFDRSECDLFRARDRAAGALQRLANGDVEAGTHDLREIAALRLGMPLGGVGDLEFVHDERRRIEEEWSHWTEELFDGDLALGRHVDVVPSIERFIAAHPYRERAHGQYLVALYRCGRHEDARLAFDRLTAILDQDLGVAPSPELLAINKQVADRDDALDAPARVPQSARLKEVGQPHAPAVPAYLLRASEVPLVGRADVVSLVEQVLQSAHNGQPVTLIVRGEPGIGKTRLAAKSAELAAARGFTIVYGRSDEDLALPYQPWIEIMSNAASSLSTSRLAEHRSRHGDTLAVLAPNLRHRVTTPISSGATTAPTTPDGQGQMEVFQAALDLIETAASDNPLVVVLDDLQWADRSTLQLLSHVAQRAAGSVAIMMLFRGTGTEADPVLEDLVADLAPLPSVHEVDLVGLEVDDVAEMIAELGGVDPDREMAKSVVGQTNGNPFFAAEVAKHLMRIDEPAAAAGSASVPLAAQRIIERRVSRLGAAAATALHAASVFGRDFELDLLAFVLEVDEFSVLESLEAGLKERILVDSADGFDRFQFVHDLMHQCLYDDLSSSRRARLHLKIADAIEKRRPQDGERRAGEIASHLLSVGDPRLAGRTCTAARSAGRAAAASLAPTDAIRWFAIALEQLDLTGNDDPALRARLLVDLGEQQIHAREPGSRATLHRAAGIAVDAGETDTLVEACIANSRGTFAQLWDIDRDLVKFHQVALASIGESRVADRARILACLASEEWDLDDDVVIARHLESIALARTTGDPAVLVMAMLRYARARGCYLQVDEHRAMNVELRAMIESNKIKNPVLILELVSSERQVALQSADVGAVAESTRAVRSLTDHMPLSFARRRQRIDEVIEIGVGGDVGRFEAAAAALFEFSLGQGDGEAMTTFEAHLLYARFMQGRTGELLAEINRIIVERPDAELYRAVSALLHVEAGLVDPASEMLADAHESGFEEGRNVFTVLSLGYWGETAAAVGDIDACKTIYRMLLPFAGEFLGNMSVLSHPADMTLGRLCTTLGHYDDARRFLENSARIATDFAAPWMQARTDWCRTVLETAAGSDDLTVGRYRDAALRVASESGYGAIERALQALR